MFFWAPKRDAEFDPRALELFRPIDSPQGAFQYDMNSRPHFHDKLLIKPTSLYSHTFLNFFVPCYLDVSSFAFGSDFFEF